MFSQKSFTITKLSWVYALLMVGAIVIVSILVYHLELRQETYVKAMYIPVLFLGILSFVRDVVQTKSKIVTFSKLLFYALRTSLFTCVFLYPLIMLFLIYFYSDGGVITMRETVVGDAGDLRVLFSLELEVFIVLLLSSLAASAVYWKKQG